MSPIRTCTQITCSTPDCGYTRTLRIAGRDDALRALLDEGTGWEIVGPLRDPSRAYCPVHASQRRAERRTLQAAL